MKTCNQKSVLKTTYVGLLAFGMQQLAVAVGAGLSPSTPALWTAISALLMGAALSYYYEQLEEGQHSEVAEHLDSVDPEELAAAAGKGTAEYIDTQTETDTNG